MFKKFWNKKKEVIEDNLSPTPVPPVPPCLPTNYINPFPKVGDLKVLPDGETIRSIVSSPGNQSMVAVGSENGMIAFFCCDKEESNRMMHSTTSTPTPQQQIAAYQGPETCVRALTFSPNNKILAAAWGAIGDIGKLILFNTKNGSIHRQQMDVPGDIDALSFSGDSKRIAIGGTKGWGLFNMETMPQSITSFEKYNAGEDFHQHEAVFSLSFCPGDDKLLVGGEEGCYLFDSKGTKLLYRFTNERTRATAFSPDGMITAVGSANKTYLYGTSGGELTNTFDHGSPKIIEFSNDGTKMILSEDSAVYGYDVLNDEQFFQSRTKNGFAHIDNDSKLIIPSGGNQVQVLQTGSLNVKELRHSDISACCYYGCIDTAISNDGQMMAFCYGYHGGLKLFDHNMGEEIKSFHEMFGQTSSFSAAFSPDGSKLVVGGGGYTMLYSITKKAGEFEFENLFEITLSQAIVIQVIFFNENGEDRIVSVLDGDKILVHSFKEQEEPKNPILINDGIPIEYYSRGGKVEVVPNTKPSQLFVKDGNKLSIYSHESKLEDEKFKFDFEGDVKAARISPDGSKLLVVVDNRLKVFEFSAEEGFDASKEDAIQTMELSSDRAESIEMISDNPDENDTILSQDTSIVAIAFNGGSIDVCSFKSWKDDFKRLCTIVTPGKCYGMYFRPIDLKESIDHS